MGFYGIQKSLFQFVSNEPFQHDVAKRIPDTVKAMRILGFEATTTLDQMLDKVIPWIKEQINNGFKRLMYLYCLICPIYPCNLQF